MRNGRRSSRSSRASPQNGGDRLERLAEEIRIKGVERDARKTKAGRYAELVRAAGGRPGEDEETFQAQRKESISQLEQVAAEEARMQNARTEHEVELHQGRQQHAQVRGELDSLKARRSNIPAEQIRMREMLCQALDLSDAEIPFAGELLQVREDERDWEGAAERLLRNFGLSLLVPDAHYPQVSEWVDRTHLRGRLVYFRVRAAARAESRALHPDSLVRKLAIKPDTSFYEWLEQGACAPLRRCLLCNRRAVSARDPRHYPHGPDQVSRRTTRKG